MSQRYDAVIIGSVICGLTCGAFLARAGMCVLVLEQHVKIGGYAHNFKRRKFTFESGIHSVAMSEGGLVTHLLRLLGVDELIPDNTHFWYALTDYEDIFNRLLFSELILPAYVIDDM